MDNRSIVFSDFEISSGSISFHFNDSFDAGDSDENRLYFNLSDPIIPQTDLIAIAISTLCGEKYFSIHYELNVSPSVLKDISVFTGAKVTASENNNVFYRTKRYNITLNFSGGFDSLCISFCLSFGVFLFSLFHEAGLIVEFRCFSSSCLGFCLGCGVLLFFFFCEVG